MNIDDLIEKGNITDITARVMDNKCINILYTLDGEKCSLVLPFESFLRKYLDL